MRQGPRVSERAARIDALLPQLQCRKCGYEGCAPYAAAIERGEAAVNRCPPGGETLIAALAALTGQAVLPLDPECGPATVRQIAWIDESRCVRCTLCIRPCPVDAITGAPKQLHLVVADHCTGCGLCLPPCPVDCIELRPHPDPSWTREQADHARDRHEARKRRLAAQAEQEKARRIARDAPRSASVIAESARRKAVIAAALARAAKKRATRARPGPDPA